jgi:hypothetical protein
LDWRLLADREFGWREPKPNLMSFLEGVRFAVKRTLSPLAGLPGHVTQTLKPDSARTSILWTTPQSLSCSLIEGKAGCTLERRGSIFIDGKEYWKLGRRSFRDTAPTGARTSARSFGDVKEGKATGGNYSTVKSAQRLSATLSIRPRGRVQIIDMWSGGIGITVYERTRPTCIFCRDI